MSGFAVRRQTGFFSIAWVVLKLITPRTGNSVVKTEYSGPADQNSQQK